MKTRCPLLDLPSVRPLFLAATFEVLGLGTEASLRVKWQVPPASPSALGAEEARSIYYAKGRANGAGVVFVALVSVLLVPAEKFC